MTPEQGAKAAIAGESSPLKRAIPPELRDLWRQRARLLAANIATEGREHREIAHAAALIRQDYHDRFLVELLQNANDQALLGGVRDSTVLVVRTGALLGVSNGGQAVTRRNLERLSSLADSDKTGVMVGNKGVGFKAVYQVTDTPELYSAGSHGSIDADFAVGVALERHPFTDATLAATVEDDIREFFHDNEGLAHALRERGVTDPVSSARAEFERLAGFKFPLARDSDDLAERLVDLRIPPSDQTAIRTLVVLPLRDERAGADVARAIDQLVGSPTGGQGQAELAVLFLGGVETIVVIDHVRDLRWRFSREIAPSEGPAGQAIVSVVDPSGVQHATRYWIIQRDALADEVAAPERRRVVEEALREFSLEAWTASDPLPVTVALPMPDGAASGSLGPAGHFCVGLPTEQSTGLPVHVDARFFATISRTGLDFGLPYNGLLLDVAAQVLDELLTLLRGASAVESRRAATLALHRSAGALADRVFAPDGIADDAVVLAWDGKTFLRRIECRMLDGRERDLVEFLEDTLVDPQSSGMLPERYLLRSAAEVLESLGLPPLRASPHPWLDAVEGASIIERAARQNRHAGPAYWERFVPALLRSFSSEELRARTWVPVGERDLAAPSDRVFLPTTVDVQGDEDEVANVPPRVAATIRLVDADTLRLRDDGRTLTSIALSLTDAGLVRRPRKAELLEDALFPALESAAEANAELALELFGQALSWIASMRDASRKKLDCSQAMVPVSTDSDAIAWLSAGQAYMGPGWGLSPAHERLLERAYPARCVVPFRTLREKLGMEVDDPASWRAAVEIMGVQALPRVTTLDDRRPPLRSWNLRLIPTPAASCGIAALDPIYSEYVQHLAETYATSWTYEFSHDVGDLYWVDGLEVAEHRQSVVDLMLMGPDTFLPHATTSLVRTDRRYTPLHFVRSMWAFALADLDWAVFPAERGAGREPIRISAGQLWRLPAGARRTAYAQVLTVVPSRYAGADRLLDAIGVPSIDGAPVGRLLEGLHDLSRRLEDERLQTRREALSLANELYARLDDRLQSEDMATVPNGITLPLLRDRRLEPVDPNDEGVTIVFDDEPARARYVVGMDKGFRVPVSRDAAVDALHDLFARTWGRRVLRTSTAPVTLEFVRSQENEERFLDWLEREFPNCDVAVELAALLTLGGERAVRAEPVSRNWKAFESLKIVFGEFRDPDIVSFYDRPLDSLWLATSLSRHEVVAKTWELAGARSRDLWEGYARALSDGTARLFLRDRDISDVELVDIADGAGLHRGRSVDAVAAALLAARCHITNGTTLDDAAAWLSGLVDHAEHIATALGRPDLDPLFTEALNAPTPEGDFTIIRALGIPWELWQEAVERRDGARYTFAPSVERYRGVVAHLAAVAREIGARDPSMHLEGLGRVVSSVLGSPCPDHVAHLPLDRADADGAAWRTIREALISFPNVSRALEDIGAPPWEDLPIPKEATRRGVRLFRDVSMSTRQVEATTTTIAVVDAAVRLAPLSGEAVDRASILADSRLVERMQGEWAHAYAALLVLRQLLDSSAPETVKRLATVQAFRDPSTLAALTARLPDLPQESTAVAEPKQSVLGVELSARELRDDLQCGSGGSLGARIAAAAVRGIEPHLLTAARTQLALVGPAVGGNGRVGGSWSGRARQEPELIGDLGEALVHEWLSATLGVDYGPDCWVSSARARYGLPACGDDTLGFDFRVPDPQGRLFGKASRLFMIEVKSTAGDGSAPFPMSHAEWERARRSHEENGDAVYVIVRVCEAAVTPRISDVVIDPFAAFRRGEIRLSERDHWVKVAPRTPPTGATET
jgi:hypothetical protein